MDSMKLNQFPKTETMLSMFAGRNLKSSYTGANTEVNVLSYGAVGDGVADDTQAFTSAWKAACAQSDSIIVVPAGLQFLIKPTTFLGPCASGLTFQILGTVIAPGDPSSWSGMNTKTWLVFDSLDGFSMNGGGTIDGRGKKWWTLSCRRDPTNACSSAPTAVLIRRGTSTTIENLTFQNSQQMHLEFLECNGVMASGITINTPCDSPNTDGIHLSFSQAVVIQNSLIGTGDDCISIQSGSANVRIKNVQCGPGHGISIGSLGEDGSVANVKDIILNGATLRGTTNGLRIKSWQGGQGSVSGVQYENVKMVNVANPIIIDQFYGCSKQQYCNNQTLAVQVNGISYRNIHGTSSTPVAVHFACSDTFPCKNLVLQNIDITYVSTKGAAASFCENAHGSSIGPIAPQSCLQ
ncbi:hypothetical protein O6H91_04G086900 [Diphasiastrum complanatum]|nr:hypothetical protein O6H91_04G086900 [Diphasiastrum complanatum]